MLGLNKSKIRKLQKGGFNVSAALDYTAAPIIVPDPVGLQSPVPKVEAPEVDFSDMDGHVVDMRGTEQQINGLMAELNSMDQFDLNTPYARKIMGQIRQLSSPAYLASMTRQKELTDSAVKQMIDNKGESELVSKNGMLYVKDMTDGAYKNVSRYDYVTNSDKYRAMTGAELANMRDQDFALFNTGEVPEYLREVKGREKVRDELLDNLTNVGSTGSGWGKDELSDISKQLEAGANLNNIVTKYRREGKSENNIKQLEAAIRGAYTMLDRGSKQTMLNIAADYVSPMDVNGQLKTREQYNSELEQVARNQSIDLLSKGTESYREDKSSLTTTKVSGGSGSGSSDDKLNFIPSVVSGQIDLVALSKSGDTGIMPGYTTINGEDWESSTIKLASDAWGTAGFKPGEDIEALNVLIGDKEQIIKRKQNPDDAGGISGIFTFASHENALTQVNHDGYRKAYFNYDGIADEAALKDLGIMDESGNIKKEYSGLVEKIYTDWGWAGKESTGDKENPGTLEQYGISTEKAKQMEAQSDGSLYVIKNLKVQASPHSSASRVGTSGPEQSMSSSISNIQRQNQKAYQDAINNSRRALK